MTICSGYFALFFTSHNLIIVYTDPLITQCYRRWPIFMMWWSPQVTVAASSLQCIKLELKWRGFAWSLCKWQYVDCVFALKVFTQKDGLRMQIFTLKPDIFFSILHWERDKSGHLKSACLHLDYNTFCQRTKGVQGLTAGDGGMRETPCSPASVLTLLWRCGFEFTANSISALDSPQIGGVKADLNPDALHWCFHFSLLETDKLPGSCRRCYFFWGGSII